jgi:hypothetical protein
LFFIGFRRNYCYIGTFMPTFRQIWKIDFQTAYYTKFSEFTVYNIAIFSIPITQLVPITYRG